VTIVEPGVSRTNFGGGAVLGAPLPEYADGPSGQLRRMLSGELPPLPAPGDPTKIAAAIIASADLPEAPLRLTLGSDAYGVPLDEFRRVVDTNLTGGNLTRS
jgi:hypothetical protein